MDLPSIPPSDGAGAGWQLVDEFELVISPNMEATVYARLTDILERLHLQKDFTDGLLNSAQDAMIRVLHPTTDSPFEHIHVSVFMPVRFASQRNIWGFFRIEKFHGMEPARHQPRHAVEFYLYLEE